MRSGYGAARRLVDRGRSQGDQQRAQEVLGEFLLGAENAITELSAARARLNADMRQGIWSALVHTVIFFSGALCVATAGCPTPDYDLSGHAIQDLADLDTPLQPVFIAAVARTDGGAVVLSHFPDHPAAARFVSSLLSQPLSLLPAAIVQTVFLHDENVFFSPSWWDTRSDSEREYITRLNLTFDAGEAIHAVSVPLTLPWRDLQIIRPEGAL